MRAKDAGLTVDFSGSVRFMKGNGGVSAISISYLGEARVYRLQSSRRCCSRAEDLFTFLLPRYPDL